MADANHRSTNGSARPHVHALPSHRMARRARPLPEKLTFFHLFWIFVIYAIFTSPDRAADLVITVWEIFVNGFAAIGIFFDRLLGR